MADTDRDDRDGPVVATTRRCALSGADAICVYDMNGQLIRVLCPSYDHRTDVCRERRAAAGKGAAAGNYVVGCLDCEFV
jgi:hypothetical protein